MQTIQTNPSLGALSLSHSILRNQCPSLNHMLIVLFLVSMMCGATRAEEPARSAWKYTPDLLRPFWQGTIMEGEPVLLIKDARTGEARASVLFPVLHVLDVRNSRGDITYEEGRD